MTHRLTAEFWVNEQDPYEPTGILYRVAPGEDFRDFADLLREKFGVQQCDLGAFGTSPLEVRPVKLTISITKSNLGA